jgi:hypothetical protein
MKKPKPQPKPAKSEELKAVTLKDFSAAVKRVLALAKK